MCYYITIALPKKDVNPILTTLPSGIKSLPTANTIVTSHLPVDYAAFCIISDMCSCDLFSPSQLQKDEKKKEALHQKYKRMGWSENKIKRALADHESNIKKSYGLRDDILCWLNSIPRCTTKSLFVLVHMYSGNIETESFKFGKITIKVDELTSLNKTFPENTLIEISN